MITYTIGSGKQYPSIQHAINALIPLFASSPANTFYDSITLEVYEGVYGGFIIPSASIPATLSKRFIIKARAGQKVTLSGTETSAMLGHGSSMIGIGIGDANPFITIDGLRIENFHKGIVFSAACYNARVQSCFIHRCANVGVWCYRSDRFTIVNSVLLDFDHGLVLTEVNDAFVAHNDIVNITDLPGTADFSDQYNIHVTTRRPTSNSPSGTIVLYNNNIVSNGGTLIGFDVNVIGKLRSDYNNLFNPVGTYAKDVSGINNSLVANNLGSWQTLSSNDLNSISVNVPYYIARQTSSSQYTDIALPNYVLFEGVARGMPDLANAVVAGATGALLPHGLIPAYVDTSELSETVQSNFASEQSAGSTSYNRLNPPSIGAYDANPDYAGFATSLVAPVGYGRSGVDSPNCIGFSLSGNTVVEEKYSQSVDCVYPSVNAGFFYLHDAQYYLYANKAAYMLEDITVSDFVLGAEIHDKPGDGSQGIQVTLNGNRLSKGSYYVRGNLLRLYHRGLNLDYNDATIHIVGTVYKFDDTSFKYETFRQTIKLSQGKKHYILPSEPRQGAPVVVTDDTVKYSDDISMLNREFTLKLDPIDKLPEIIFSHNDNMIKNPQFDYVSSGSVNGWEIYNNSGAYLYQRYITATGDPNISVSTGSVNGTAITRYYTGLTSATGAYYLYPVLGSNLLVLSGLTNTDRYNAVRQRIKIDSKTPYWLSTYTAKVKEPFNTSFSVNGDLKVSYKWYDIEQQAIPYPTGDPYTGSCFFPITSDYTYATGLWTRVAVPFAWSKDNTLNKPGPTGVVVIPTMTGSPIPIPDKASYIDIILAATGGMAISCVSMTPGYDMHYYTRKPYGNEMTVEYETGLSNLYKLHDLTLTPARNRNNAGFLYIGPVPASQFDRNAPENTTTLTDYGWPTGRLLYLPWAKTSGKNKLSHRTNFNIDNQRFSEDTFINSAIAYPDNITTIPRIPIANLEDGIGPTEQIAQTGMNRGPGVRGSDFTVKVTDTNGNPYAFEKLTVELLSDIYAPPARNYLGMLAKRDLGFYTEYNTKIETLTDSAGCATIRWIPPASDNTHVEISNPQVDIKVDQGDAYPYYYLPNLPYKVNQANMGNAFLTTPHRPDGYPSTGASYAYETIGAQISNAGSTRDIKVYALKDSPHKETFDLWVNATGVFPPSTGITNVNARLSDAYDLLLYQSDNPEIVEGEYFVDESKRLVFLKFNKETNDDTKSIRVRYKPRNFFTLADNNGAIDYYRMYFSHEFYHTLVREVSPGNPLSMLYDIAVDLIITAHSPTGMTQEMVEVIDNIQSTGTAIVNIREKVYNGSMIGKCIARRIGL